MVGKCANNFCTTVRGQNRGKLFRLDLEIASRSGNKDEYRTEYIWLCDRCARVLHPEVQVNGNTVTLRLTRNSPAPIPLETPALWKHAN